MATTNTLTGSLVAPGSYVFSADSTGDCGANFNINIGNQDFSLSTSRYLSQSTKIEVGSMVCLDNLELQSSPIGGIRTVNCSSGQHGLLRYKCLLTNNVPTWTVIYNTCSYPKLITYFHYGVSSIRVNVGSTVTLTPYTDGAVDSYQITPQPTGSITFDTYTGSFKLLSTTTADPSNYTIIGVSIGKQYRTIIEVQFVVQITVAPVRNLQILPSPYFGFASNIPVMIKFKFSSGNVDSCDVTPSLPNGILIDKTRIYGYSELVDNTPKTYTLQCRNADSVSNQYIFTLPVSPTNGLKQGMLATYWRYVGTATQISCNTQWEPYVTAGTEVVTVRVDTTINQSPTDQIWPGLNGYFNDNWGVRWNGYINIDETGQYTFSTRSIDGSWVEIDDVIVSTNYLCHDFNQASIDTPIRLEKGYHRIIITYFNRIGQQGFNLMYTFNNKTTVVPDNKLFYLPQSTLTYNTVVDTYAKDRSITTNRPAVIGSCGSYSSTPALSGIGLTIDAAQGTISGTPRTVQSEQMYTISCRSGSDTYTTDIVIAVKDFTLPTNVGVMNLNTNEQITSLLTLYPGQKNNLQIQATGTVSSYSIVGGLPANFTFDSGTATITAFCITPFANSVINYRVTSDAGYVTSNISVSCSSVCPTDYENINITFPYGASMKKTSVRFKLLSQSDDVLIDMNGDTLFDNSYYMTCSRINQLFKIRGSNTNTNELTINIQSRTSLLLALNIPPALGGQSSIISYDHQFIVSAPVIEYSSTIFTFTIPEDISLSPTKPNVISNCVVSPQLPLGLSIDPYSCKILGTPYEAKQASTYTIRASNAAGQSPEVTISIAIKDCADDNKIFFEMYFYTGDTPNGYAWEVVDKQQENIKYLSVEYNSATMKPNSMYKFVGCMVEDNVRIKVSSAPGTAWNNAEVTFLVVGKNYGTYSKITTASAQFFLVNVDVLVSPIRKWKLSTKYSGTKQWYTESYESLPWNEQNDGSTGASFSENITHCYLVTNIPMKPIDSEVPSYKVVLTHVSGVILYVNGVEYYRRFLPTTIANDSFANGAFNNPTPVTLILPISSLNPQSSNTISIAIYRRSTDGNPSYRISLYGTLMDKTLSCLTHTNLQLVSQSGNYRSNEDASKAIDGSKSTDWTELLSLNPGSTAQATFKFPDNWYVWVNNYGFVSSRNARENPSNNPLDMEFRGLTTTWATLGDPLATRSINVGGSNQELLYYHFSDTTLFNQVRVIITATYGTESDMSLAEVLFQTCHVYYCKAQDGFAGAPQDSIATAECARGYLGDRTRECGLGKNPEWGPIDDSNCKIGPPVDFSYPQKSYILNTYIPIPTGTIVPKYTSVLGVTFQAQTQLPNGIQVNPDTGEIYGTPTDKLTPKDYTINCKNSKGEFISTKITLTIERRSCFPDGDWPGTEGGSTAEIKCVAGMTGIRRRICNDADVPYWGEADETLCRDDVTKGTKVPVAIIVIGAVLSVIGVSVIVLCVWIRCKNSSKSKGKGGSIKLSGGGHKANASGRSSSDGGRSIKNAGGEKKSARSVRL